MQLPVNVSEVLKIATDMKEVANTPISASIYIDDTAPGALVGHVRSAFSSAAEHTRVTIDYLDDDPINIKSNEDAGILVAGDSPRIGEEAKRLRDAGVPAMVVCADPAAVEEIARQAGCPIPAADVVAPVKLESQLVANIVSKIPFVGAAGPSKHGAERVEDTPDGPVVEAVGDDSSVGAVALDEESFRVLDTRMGKWVISAIKDKDLAFAMSFPFIRRPLAEDAITATSLQNCAVGLVPFLPGADMPIMTLNQVKMTLQIATAYGQPLDVDRVKEIAVIVAGAFLCRNLVRTATKAIPFAGWVISGGMGFAATEAMGRAMIEYFEAGGDIVGVASVMQTARDAAMKASKQAAASPAGQSLIAKAKQLAGDVAAAGKAK